MRLLVCRRWLRTAYRVRISMTHEVTLVTSLEIIRCEVESLCPPMTISIPPNGSAAYSLIGNSLALIQPADGSF